MRAIHINPWTRTIREVDLDDDGDSITYEALRDAVFNRSKDQRCIERVDLGGGIDCWLDEEGLLMDWDSQRFVQLCAPDGSASRTLAGHLILTGSDGWGNSTALPLFVTPERLASVVRWIEPRDVRVPAPMFQSLDDEGNVIEQSGGGWWTYDNQPC